VTFQWRQATRLGLARRAGREDHRWTPPPPPDQSTRVSGLANGELGFSPRPASPHGAARRMHSRAHVDPRRAQKRNAEEQCVRVWTAETRRATRLGRRQSGPNCARCSAPLRWGWSRCLDALPMLLLPFAIATTTATALAEWLPLPLLLHGSGLLGPRVGSCESRLHTWPCSARKNRRLNFRACLPAAFAGLPLTLYADLHAQSSQDEMRESMLICASICRCS
jgi:hypothetical protein